MVGQEKGGACLKHLQSTRETTGSLRFSRALSPAPGSETETHGIRQLEESTCFDSSGLDDTFLMFDRDGGNYRRATGLHR
jgi:hypothetical protein